jgi:hypothetical protein
MALLATACTNPASSTVDQPHPTGGATPTSTPLTPGDLMVSDGSDTVTIGGKAVRFPSTVTDAAWSPDGSRIAYIDVDGNVAIAHADGTGVVVLTTTNPSVVRSRPAWSREWIYYAEKKTDGTSTLMYLRGDGCGATGAPEHGSAWNMDTGNGTSYVDLAPSAALPYRPGRLAFQHDEPSGPEIWINDSVPPSTYKVTTGSEPALSPDGQQLAYVGPNGQIHLSNLATHSSVQITFGADHPTRLAWNPDGQHIAYETPTAVDSVGVSAGASSNPATTISAKTGVPSFRAAERHTIARITDADPIALSITVSQLRWPPATPARIANGLDAAQGATLTTPDWVGVTGMDLGVSLNPLLVTSGASLDPRTQAELQRLFSPTFAAGHQPYIGLVGNEFSSSVKHKLESLGYQVEDATNPVPGPDASTGPCGPQYYRMLWRQKVVAVKLTSGPDYAFGSYLARSWGVPMLLLQGGHLDDDLKAYLDRSAPLLDSVYIVDSSGAISPDVEKQIGDLVSGPAGYDTTTNPVYAAP